MSKNIELSQANHLFQINMTLNNKNENENKETDDDKKTEKKNLFSKEEKRISCIGIFSTSFKHETSIKGTINLIDLNTDVYNNTHMNNYIMPGLATNKKQGYRCKLNIDLHSLSNIKLKRDHQKLIK